MDLHKAGERYVMEIPSSAAICNAQQARTERYASHLSWAQVREWAKTVRAEEWARIEVREGAKGPVVVNAVR